MTDLLRLAERCEQAPRADDAIDLAINETVHRYHSHNHIWNGTVPRYTASLDAAVRIVPEGMIMALTNCDADGAQPVFGRASAIVGHADDPNGPTVAATMALALCAAALKALASGIETEGHDGATRHGAEHESPTPKGDAQP